MKRYQWRAVINFTQFRKNGMSIVELIKRLQSMQKTKPVERLKTSSKMDRSGLTNTEEYGSLFARVP